MAKEMVYMMRRISGKEDHYITDKIKQGKKVVKRNLKQERKWK